MNRLLYCGVVAGPLFVLTFLVNGAFVTDPVSGYPPGSPALSPEYTWHGLVHDLFAVPTFVGWPIACFVLAHHFRRWYSIASGMAFAMTFVLTNAAFAQTPGLVEVGGLLQRLTIIIGFTWLAVFGAAMLVKRRGLD